MNAADAWAVAGATLRAGIVAALAVGLARCVVRRLTRLSGPGSALGYALLLLPLLSPPAFIGYAYQVELNWFVGDRRWEESVYGLLLTLRVLPVAGLVLLAAPPPPMSPPALHCGRLSGAFPGLAGLFVRLIGPARSAVLAWAAAFVLTFQDFEIASLIMIDSTWTVRLFEARQMHREQFAALIWAPLAVTLGVLIPAGVLLMAEAMGRDRLSGAEEDPRAARRTRLGDVLAWGSLLVGAAVLWGLPLAVFAPWLAEAAGAIGQIRGLVGQLGFSLALAGGATVGALLLAAWLVRPAGGRWWGRMKRWTLVGLCLPGLMGSLLLGLGVIAVFQSDAMNHWYGRLPPLTLGMALLAMPSAALMAVLRRRAGRSEATWAARLAATSDHPATRRAAAALRWDLSAQPWLGLGLVIFALLFFELTLATLLQPIRLGWNTHTQPLYNQMHYGRSAQVLGRTLASLLALLLALLAVGGARWVWIALVGLAGLRKGAR